MSLRMKSAAWMAMVTAAAASVSSTAFAAEITKATLSDKHGGSMAIAAALAISVAVVGGALGQGKAATAALEGIARNPGAASKLQTPMILGLALIESLVIYALLIAFQLVPSA